MTGWFERERDKEGERRKRDYGRGRCTQKHSNNITNSNRVTIIRRGAETVDRIP